MSENVHNAMPCSEFESLLGDAMEGVLTAAQTARFQAHAATCPNCGPIFEFAQAGFQSLHELPKVEPPRHLVHNILVATSGAEIAKRPAAVKLPWRDRVRGWVRPVLAPVFSPRVAMSTGMAFFSFMLVLNLAGVKLSDLRHLDLRPSAVQHAAQHTYYDTEARVVKYYENIRLVYQIQSSVRVIKDAEKDNEDNGKQKQQQPRKDKKDTSSDPNRRQQQQYSRELRQHTLALNVVPAPLTEEPLSPQNRRLS